MTDYKIPINGINEWRVEACPTKPGVIHAIWPATPGANTNDNIHVMQIHLVTEDDEPVFRLTCLNRELALIAWEFLWLVPVEQGIEEAIRSITVIAGGSIEGIA